MQIFLLFWVFFSVNANQFNHPFDFIEDVLERIVDWKADPCDDFYRHACPLGNYSDFVNDSFLNMTQFLSDKRKNESWRNLKIQKDYQGFSKRLESVLTPSEMSNFFTTMFFSVCDSNRLGIASFISKVAETVNALHKEAPLKLKLTDKNIHCNMKIEDVEQLLEAYFMKLKKMDFDYLRDSHQIITDQVEFLTALYGHLDIDVQKGINETVYMMKKMTNLADKWLEKTPWVIKKKVLETIQRLTSLTMHTGLENDLNNTLQRLSKIDRKYDDCLYEFKSTENIEMFCYIYTTSRLVQPFHSFFYLNSNGRITNNDISLSFPNYYHTQYGKWQSSKLGYTGTRVGHEIGHAFINYKLPFFSKKAQDCIQNQYKKLCKEFKEDQCKVTDKQFSDNGSDIFGLQLAYALLKEEYGEELYKYAENLHITNEKLFFYSFAYRYCHGSKRSSQVNHSASNVRINMVAQLPEFRKAFQCSDSSRMVRSATEQCIIYGKYAPETRRKLVEHN